MNVFDTGHEPAASGRPLSIAIVAMGGQGGGVLADWITSLARAQNHHVQATSVAGVAQRTGATIYYIEMMPRRPGKPEPVLALMPAPGDVDVVIASEWMEAGRAILRGLVSRDRTTLIASTQRALAVVEKQSVGNGIADSGAVHLAATIAARRQITADFAAIAERAGSVISASLFGALAASGALPFPRSAFENAIRAGGVGIETSLKAFDAAFARAGAVDAAPPAEAPTKASPAPLPERTGIAELDALLGLLRGGLPEPTWPMAYAGIKHLTDYQDTAYARAYLETLEDIATLDRQAGGDAHGFVLTIETARHLARAMAYDDVIRVADLKTRPTRRERVTAEAAVDPEQVLHTTEFFHPRMEEVCASLPRALGAAIEARPRLMSALDRIVDRGRRVRTDTVWGYLQLHLIANRKRKRRTTLRHTREAAHITRWLDHAKAALAHNYDFAVEIIKARRFVKGYSDTMSRGLSKFDRILLGAKMVEGRPDAAAWVRRLHLAALVDENGDALDGALKTLATLDAAATTIPSERTTA